MFLNTSVVLFKMYFENLEFILGYILGFQNFENILLLKLPAT